MYERSLERAEVEAVMEWRRCFVEGIAETQPYHTELGSAEAAGTITLPILSNVPADLAGIRLCDWAPPVVQELSVANQSLCHDQS